MLVLFIVFCATIGIQLIYYFVFLAAFSKKKSAQSSAEQPALPVSVIVCAHDEEENLKELVPLLLSQSHPEFEVIIVDDRSNDGTFDWLLEETRKDHRLRMVHVNRTPPHVNGKKYGLTLGIKAAKYEWLLLTDADCRPAGNQWISTMAAHFSNDTRFVLGQSPYIKQKGFLNLFVRFEAWITALQYFSYALLGNPYMGVGRNLAYRKSMFMDTKGFNNHLHVTGGDDDLYVNEHARAANTAVSLDGQSAMHSAPVTTWKSFFRQKIRHLSVGKHYRFGHRFLLGIFMITWLLFWTTGLILLALQPPVEYLYTIAGAWFVRALLLSLVINYAVKKLGQRFEAWAVPLLDFIYAFYYLVTGLIALVSKKVRWKN